MAMTLQSVKHDNCANNSATFQLENVNSSQGKTLLRSYTPLNNIDLKISIFHDATQGIYSEVSENKQKYILPVQGYPDEIANSLNKLMLFFLDSHVVVKKSEYGESYVRAIPSFIGKGILEKVVLPASQEYSLGTIIKKDTLTFQILKQKQQDLEDELSKAQNEKQLMLDSPDFKSLNRDEKQLRLNLENVKINKKCDDIKNIDNVISQLSPLDEILPFDIKNSQFKNVLGSLLTERMEILVLTKTDKDHLKEQVENFVSKLFLKDAPSYLLSSTELENVTSKIEKMFETETRVSLIGSFVILPQVRTMDRIVITKKSVSDNLSTKSDDYYILTDAILGAVFLGFGKAVSSSKSLDRKITKEEKDKESIPDFFPTVSFISKGAVCTFNKDRENSDLWNIYTSWKDTLRTDPESGYPIGYKSRKLRDILRQNDIPIED